MPDFPEGKNAATCIYCLMAEAMKQSKHDTSSFFYDLIPGEDPLFSFMIFLKTFP
jgi:hypothetical protein